MRTRTRLKLVGQADEPAPVDATDDDSVANVRFSAAKIANDDLASLSSRRELANGAPVPGRTAHYSYLGRVLTNG